MAWGAAVQVLPTLQVEGSPKVFAVGDCNNVAETKLGYFASAQVHHRPLPKCAYHMALVDLSLSKCTGKLVIPGQG